jgi:hypothetical protein
MHHEDGARDCCTISIEAATAIPTKCESMCSKTLIQSKIESISALSLHWLTLHRRPTYARVDLASCPLCHPVKGTSYHHCSVKSKQSTDSVYCAVIYSYKHVHRAIGQHISPAAIQMIRLRRLRSRSSRDAVCNWRPRPNATSKAFCATTWAGWRMD